MCVFAFCVRSACVDGVCVCVCFLARTHMSCECVHCIWLQQIHWEPWFFFRYCKEFCDANKICLGHQCFRLTFAFGLLVNLSGILSGLALVVRQYRRARQGAASGPQEKLLQSGSHHGDDHGTAGDGNRIN